MKTLFAILILSTSCSKAQLTKNEITKNIGEPLSKQFQGNIYSKKTTNNSVLLFIDSAISKSNNYTLAILLESDKKLASDKIKEGRYDIFIPKSGRYLVISSTENKFVAHIGLFDDESKLNELSNKFLPGIDQQIFLGYGLSYMKSLWDKKLVDQMGMTSSEDILVKTDIHLLQKGILSNSVPGVTCHSGGSGSSSCAIEEGFPTTQQCSVTCNAGYFACCNTTTFKCKCYVNGTAEN